MKTLSDHVIIYDDECPMCKLYTGAFIKSGMLDQRGRVAYSSMTEELSDKIDVQRSRDEIALVDNKTGTIRYGIDSLFHVLSNSFPVVKPLFQCPPFRTVMKYVYSLISYNRKVIAPADAFESAKGCTPHFNVRYRWAYIVFTWFITSLVLSNYVKLLQPLLPSSSYFREWLICGGQIAFQGIVFMFKRKDRVLHYLGNMMTVSALGALLLIPTLLLSLFNLNVNPGINLIWFLMVVTVMLFEHSRRVKILELPGYLTATWVLYRLFVLAIIL